MFRRSFQFSSIGLTLLYLQLCSGECTRDEGVGNIDMDEIAGRWYVVAFSPARQNVSRCLFFDVIVNRPNRFTINLTSLKVYDSSFKPTLMLEVDDSRAIGLKTGNVLMEYWRNGDPSDTYVQKFLVMDTKKYCASIVCSADSFTETKYFGMVWSRTPRIPHADLLYLKDKIAEYVNETEIVDVMNSCWM